MHDCQRDSHATSPTTIYANITQTGRISMLYLVLGRFGWFCRWFWLVLLVVLGGFGWFWVVLGGFGWFRVLVTTSRAPPLILPLLRHCLGNIAKKTPSP